MLMTIQDVPGILNGNSAALLIGQFVSWCLAKELDKKLVEIIISDRIHGCKR